MRKCEKKDKPFIQVFCNCPVEKSYYSCAYINSNEGNGRNLILEKGFRECWNQNGPCITCACANVHMGVFADKLMPTREFVAIPIRQIKTKEFKDLYKLFEQVTDNAHTTPDTVVVYLLKHENPETTEMLWTCNHFEEQGAQDVTGLALFMQELQEVTGGMATLELIDTYSEKLMIAVNYVKIDFPKTAADKRNLHIREDQEDASLSGDGAPII